VPVNTRAFPRFDREIADYLRTVRGTSARCPALFLTPADRGAEPAAYRRMTTSAIQSLFARLALDNGIRIHPHVCRHTMGRDGSRPAYRPPS
jgi:integrase